MENKFHITKKEKDEIHAQIPRELSVLPFRTKLVTLAVRHAHVKVIQQNKRYFLNSRDYGSAIALKILERQLEYSFPPILEHALLGLLMGIDPNEPIFYPEEGLKRVKCYVNMLRKKPALIEHENLDQIAIFSEITKDFFILLHHNLLSQVHEFEHHLSMMEETHKLDSGYMHELVRALCEDDYLNSDFIEKFPSENRENLDRGILWLLGKAYESTGDRTEAVSCYTLAAEKGFSSLYENVARLKVKRASRIDMIEKARQYAQETGYRQKENDLKETLVWLRSKPNTTQVSATEIEVELPSSDESDDEAGILWEVDKHAALNFSKLDLTTLRLETRHLNSSDLDNLKKSLELIKNAYQTALHGGQCWVAKPTLLSDIQSENIWWLRNLALMIQENRIEIPEAELRELLVFFSNANDELQLQPLEVNFFNKPGIPEAILTSTLALIQRNLTQFVSRST